jgi:FkbM family methyltransferase
MNLKDLAKSIVPSNSWIRRFLVSAYHVSKYRTWRPGKLRNTLISTILDNYSKYKTQIKFIQIGSNDGVDEDPLRQFILRDHWKGVLVEPLPATFQKLLKNYDDYEHKKDISFENAAISDKSGRKILFYIDAKKANVSESVNKYCSFNKAIPLKLKWKHPDIERSICEIEIETLSFSALLDKHNLRNDLNLLHIDTEGHDHVILEQVDFTVTRPDIVLFENLHMKLKAYRKCVKELRKNNYFLFEQKLDTIAIHQRFINIVTKSTSDSTVDQVNTSERNSLPR